MSKTSVEFAFESDVVEYSCCRAMDWVFAKGNDLEVVFKQEFECTRGGFLKKLICLCRDVVNLKFRTRFYAPFHSKHIYIIKEKDQDDWVVFLSDEMERVVELKRVK